MVLTGVGAWQRAGPPMGRVGEGADPAGRRAHGGSGFDPAGTGMVLVLVLIWAMNEQAAAGRYGRDGLRPNCGGAAG